MPVRTGKDFKHSNPNLKLDNGGQLVGDLEADLYIDNSFLEEEFLKQPELFAWWATATELAKDLVGRQKFVLERMAATLDHGIRLSAVSNPVGGKPIKLTEAQITHQITSDEKYQEAMLAYLEYKKQLGMLQAGKEAMEQRRDMLISLGANYRAEASSNPSILMGAARDRARRAAEEKRRESSSEPETEAEPEPPPKKMPGKRPA